MKKKRVQEIFSSVIALVLSLLFIKNAFAGIDWDALSRVENVQERISQYREEVKKTGVVRDYYSQSQALKIFTSHDDSLVCENDICHTSHFLGLLTVLESMGTSVSPLLFKELFDGISSLSDEPKTVSSLSDRGGAILALFSHQKSWIKDYHLLIKLNELIGSLKNRMEAHMLVDFFGKYSADVVINHYLWNPQFSQNTQDYENYLKSIENDKKLRSSGSTVTSLSR